MGRPLFSTLIEPAVRVAEPVCANSDDVGKTAKGAEKTECERWSISNPFDPDDDAFFNNEHAVYEAFLSEDGVRARATRVVNTGGNGTNGGNSAGALASFDMNFDGSMGISGMDDFTEMFRADFERDFGAWFTSGAGADDVLDPMR